MNTCYAQTNDIDPDPKFEIGECQYASYLQLNYDITTKDYKKRSIKDRTENTKEVQWNEIGPIPKFKWGYLGHGPQKISFNVCCIQKLKFLCTDLYSTKLT